MGLDIHGALLLLSLILSLFFFFFSLSSSSSLGLWWEVEILQARGRVCWSRPSRRLVLEGHREQIVARWKRTMQVRGSVFASDNAVSHTLTHTMSRRVEVAGSVTASVRSGS
ncbi:hypothetical protein V8C44DRAFT_334653 [Trichoderma aethiopicum]